MFGKNSAILHQLKLQDIKLDAIKDNQKILMEHHTSLMNTNIELTTVNANLMSANEKLIRWNAELLESMRQANDHQMRLQTQVNEALEKLLHYLSTKN